jgi:phenylalanyl-tRNA synthetase beta chain
MLPKLETILITREKISSVLGFDLDPSWIESKFKFLGFNITKKNNNSWSIIPPSYRFDIRIPEDLIEELVRLYGYDKAPVQRLTMKANISQTSQSNVSSYDISQALVNRGYQEVITYSFISNEYHDLIDPDAKKIELKNPISDDMSIMRSSLWPGLLQTVEMNQRRGHYNARFFEAGLCFGGISVDEQKQKIAGIVCGERFESQWGSSEREVDFFDAKSDVESLLNLSGNDYLFEAAEHSALQAGQTAKISRNGQLIGWIGALSPHLQKKLSLPKVFLFEVNQSDIGQRKVSSYQSFSSFQASQRDIALVVAEDINADQLIHAIQSLNQEYLIEVNLFDVYEGEHIDKGKKSVALNLTYQSIEATLTDDQLNQQVEDIITHLESKFSAKLR